MAGFWAALRTAILQKEVPEEAIFLGRTILLEGIQEAPVIWLPEPSGESDGSKLLPKSGSIASWAYRDSIFDIGHLSCEKPGKREKRQSRRWVVFRFLTPDIAIYLSQKAKKQAISGWRVADFKGPKDGAFHLSE